MYRIAMEKLLKWKQSKRRKPLIIEGARQVGKTWLMKEFGKQAYADTVLQTACLRLSGRQAGKKYRRSVDDR